MRFAYSLKVDPVGKHLLALPEDWALVALMRLCDFSCYEYCAIIAPKGLLTQERPTDLSDAQVILFADETHVVDVASANRCHLEPERSCWAKFYSCTSYAEFSSNASLYDSDEEETTKGEVLFCL